MRPDETMNRKLWSEERMWAQDLNLGQRRKRARGDVMRVEFLKADQMRRGVEGHVEMGGLGKVNLHLFTDEPRLEQMKHLLQESVSRG